MISRMMKLVNSSDNLFLTPPQQKEVVDYAKSLQRRFEAARHVERNEVKILDSAIVAIQDNNPEIGDIQDCGWEGYTNDLTFTLRAVVQGMLIDDTDHASLIAVKSLAKQLSFLDFSSEAIRGVFKSLAEACTEHVPAEAGELLKTYFDAAVQAA